MSFFRRGGSEPAATAPLPYSPQSPEGLAARWVRWAASAGPVKNPVADTTGENAGLHQPGDVWFLAGTFGGEVQRSCALPEGVPLFFPSFNAWTVPGDAPPQPFPDAVGTVEVDGTSLVPDVIGTPVPFEVAGARMNPVTGTRKPVPVTVWGLWKRLDPLPAGAHVVRFGGGSGHGFTVSATYHLTVI